VSTQSIEMFVEKLTTDEAFLESFLKAPQEDIPSIIEQANFQATLIDEIPSYVTKEIQGSGITEHDALDPLVLETSVETIAGEELLQAAGATQPSLRIQKPTDKYSKLTDYFNEGVDYTKLFLLAPFLLHSKIVDKLKRLAFPLSKGKRLDLLELWPGDILLVSIADTVWSDTIHEFICLGQSLNLHLVHGQTTSVHAAVYVGKSEDKLEAVIKDKLETIAHPGEHCIAEAVGEGLRVRNLVEGDKKAYPYLVFRNRSSRSFAEEAARIAKEHVLIQKGENPGFGSYTKLGAMFSVANYAPLSQKAFLEHAKTLKQRYPNYPAEFFCSHFVTYCYALATFCSEPPSSEEAILLNYLYTTPMQLENYCRSHSNWELVGHLESVGKIGSAIY